MRMAAARQTYGNGNAHGSVQLGRPTLLTSSGRLGLGRGDWGWTNSCVVRWRVSETGYGIEGGFARFFVAQPSRQRPERLRSPVHYRVGFRFPQKNRLDSTPDSGLRTE